MLHTPNVRGGGSVQRGLSAAGSALGFCRLGLAADKRYSLGYRFQIDHDPMKEPMSRDTEKLIDLIRHKDSFHEATNKELNILLTKVEPHQIPLEYRRDLADIIDVMFLTDNVLAANKAHIDRIHQFLIQNTTPC